jgi:Ca-activated chloride channel family protein
MRVERGDAASMTASYEGSNVAPRGAFELNVLPAGAALPAGLSTYRTPGQDGFFMLWLSPELRQEAVVDKDVVLVLDVSGSMAGRKILQAKAALRYVLNRLNPGDRFNIVAFSSSVDRFAATLQPVDQVPLALTFVDGLRAEGGTNINDALVEGLSFSDPERQTTLIFLTDGLPTSGETSRDRILRNVEDRAGSSTRLFVFGVGDDVDTTLLDSLATRNRGDVQYVPPVEDVEEKVSTLYSRVGSPQLTDLLLEFGGANVYDLYPAPLPDLFGGQTLYVFGRYRSTGVYDLALSGTSRDGVQRHTFPALTLAAEERGASYLP